ncbi:hypothetical protein Cni_G18638 [Canna indica]|uniref:LOB domain-containing protein n=1 Tax=Canna indica TaxID=4628 RepID=A0AAQ3QIY5_9LILI|nr:hypothetical protein Cni_G18638 [Canna indica]
MAGFGSPCGACKFLRRKCISGCVFAPYFRHEQGAAHFAAIHKVFGASNVAKLLMHLPMADRPEAAVTISYEAQARLQNPIYGCVAHIFALQQQVVNLQAQVASLEAQAARGVGNSSRLLQAAAPLPPHRQDFHGFINQAAGGAKATAAAQVNASSSSMDLGCINNCGNWMSDLDCLQDFIPNFDMVDEDFSSIESNNCFDLQDSFWKSAYQDMDDLQRMAFANAGR